MKSKTFGMIALLAGAVAATVVVTGFPFGGPRNEAIASQPMVDHGPEPTLGKNPGGQVAATAVFWASDAQTPPEALAFSVGVGNPRNLSAQPAVRSCSEVRDGKRYVSVVLDFPFGAVRDDPSIDLTVTFTNKSGRSASQTMTVDSN